MIGAAKKPRFKHSEYNKQCREMVVGSALTNTQFSIEIDTYQETNDGAFKEGELQAKGIQLLEEYLPFESLEIVKKFSDKQKIIVYILFHHSRGKKMIHGAIITDEKNKVLHRFYMNRRHTSNQIINATSEWLERRNKHDYI